LLAVGGLTVLNHPTPAPAPQQQQQVQPPSEKKIEPPPPPAVPSNPKISVTTPSYLSYDKLTAQLDQWAKEAPGLTERGSYGATSKGQKIQYLRVTNLVTPTTQPKKVVMITACIHGNEPLATGTVMAWMGNFISKYGTDKEITDLINTRDIYFIPVVSPDSYPNSRYVDGVDPNRNFPCPAKPNVKSVPPIKSIQDFFLKIKPSAAISGHTSGRMILVPWGDSMQNCPDFASYKSLVSDQLCKLTGYRFLRACDVYGLYYQEEKVSSEYMTPIYGGELDWYYRNGAFSVVFEFGTHQQIPSQQDIQTEFDRTFRAMLLFVKDAPNVQLQQR
jgi:Zinc carboxypeptidase